MKKSAVLFLMMSLLFAGCSNTNGNIVILDDSQNNGHSSLASGDEDDLVAVVHVQTICFTDRDLNIADYLGLTNESQKEFDKMDDLSLIYEKIETAGNNHQVSFVDGTNLSEDRIDFSKNKVVLYTTVHNYEASYFSISNTETSGKNINITLKQRMEISFDPTYSTVGLVYAIVAKTRNVKININYQMDENVEVVKKPIVYFYPEKEMDLSVKYVNEDKLLTTYPKYNGGWDIHLNEDGTFVTDANNREYYALYFDELPNYRCTFEEGFYVNKDNAINFLEEKMDFIGYTNREVDEFMMYWLPILESNKHSLVYFEQTEERNEECPLIFSTNPDTLIRTIIHIKKVDGEVNIPEQQLKHYDRKGFVVTDWGGTEY